MEQLRQNDLQALMECIRRVYAISNLDAYPAGIIDAVRTLLPCAQIGYNEINLRRKRAVVVFEPPELMTSDLIDSFTRHMGEHPVIRHYQRKPDGQAYKISDFLSHRQFQDSSLYNEFFRLLGTKYQISTQLAMPRHAIVGIAVNRDRIDFTERERLLLNLLQPHLGQAYQNIARLARLWRALDGGQQCLVLLDVEGRIVHTSEKAWHYLEVYGGGMGSAFQDLPEPLRAWLRLQKNQLKGNDDVPPPLEPLVLRKDKRQLVVQFVTGGEAMEHDLLLLEEQDCDSLGTILATLGLSGREREIMHLIVLGQSSAEIAETLTLSRRTVETHLDRIYRKLGVHTRAAALGKVLQLRTAGDSADESR